MPSPKKSQGARNRRKGHDFERSVALIMRAAFPWHAENIRRGLQSQGGDVAPDVECPYFWIECKARQNPEIEKALLKATFDAHAAGKPALVISKRPRKHSMASMWEDEFRALVAGLELKNLVGERTVGKKSKREFLTFYLDDFLAEINGESMEGA